MKTLSNILKGFDKTLSQLEAFMTATETQQADNFEQIERLQSRNALLDLDYQRAEKAAVKIRDIIGK